MTSDPHVLTGAYALHAIPPGEVVIFERHLATCEPCTREVAEFRTTASRLGLATTKTPPPQLRAAVLGQITRIRQGRRWSAARFSAMALAVLFGATVALGTVALNQRQSLVAGQATADAVAVVMDAADQHVTHTDGITVMSSRSADRVVLVPGDLPSPPANHGYRTWLVGTNYRMVGRLTPNGATVTARLGDSTRITVTIEPEGRIDHPTGKPIRTVPIP